MYSLFLLCSLSLSHIQTHTPRIEAAQKLLPGCSSKLVLSQPPSGQGTRGTRIGREHRKPSLNFPRTEAGRGSMAPTGPLEGEAPLAIMYQQSPRGGFSCRHYLMHQLPECLCELKRNSPGHIDTSSGRADSTGSGSLAAGCG